MRVLVCASNLFEQTGGGQSFYQNYVTSTKCDFVSFRDAGIAPHASPHVDVRAVRNTISSAMIATKALSGLRTPCGVDLSGREHEIGFFYDIASAVVGEDFDVIEIPDYYPFAFLLPAILRQYGVTFRKVVVSMHGTLHAAIKNNWGSSEGDTSLDVLSECDYKLYRVADIRYGIGHHYVEEWQQRSALPCTLIDPIDVYQSFLRTLPYSTTLDPVPELWFVGRHDLIKSPDLFIEMVGRLPQTLYSRVRMFGGAVDRLGVSSVRELQRQADTLRLSVEFTQLPYARLVTTLAQSPAMIIHPSRRDTFNLAALEAVVLGKPVAVSAQCGVSWLLDKAGVGDSYLKLDIHNFEESTAQVREWVARYPNVRSDGHAARQAVMSTRFGLKAGDVYAVPHAWDEKERSSAFVAVEAISRRVSRSRASEAQLSSQGLTHALATLAESCCKEEVTIPNVLRDLDVLEHFKAELSSDRKSRCTYGGIPYAVTIHTQGYLKAEFLHLLAQSEVARGNESAAAAYLLRVIRLAGFRNSPIVGKTLTLLGANGKSQEAEVLELLCCRPEAVAQWVRERRSAAWQVNRSISESVWLHGDKTVTPRVSVVCSVYNGHLQVQPFVRSLLGALALANASYEILFIDSCSTDGSDEAIRRAAVAEVSRHSVRGVVHHVRTNHRESIQAAWNRGISRARGEFICFPGLDEAFMPTGVAGLIKALEQHPEANWAEGDAIVYNVDHSGNIKRQCFGYRRYGCEVLDALLDSTLISFVGTLSRRSLFNQKACFDDTFRGAGDTDFKMRFLDRIRLITIDETTGCFLNYPAERVTSSFQVEIEDLRAWYAYRTPEALVELLQPFSTTSIVGLLKKATRHRKSYIERDSSDWLLFSSLMEVVRAREDFNVHDYDRESLEAFDAYANGYQQVLRAAGGSNDLSMIEKASRSAVAWFAKGLIDMKNVLPRPVMDWASDNAQQQHSYVWPTSGRPQMCEQWRSVAHVAGIQNLAEAMAAAGSMEESVSYNYAWRTGNTGQIRRASAFTQYGVAIPVECEHGLLYKAVKATVTDLLSTIRGVPIVLVGRSSRNCWETLFPGESTVFYTGAVTRVAPIFALSRLLLSVGTEVSHWHSDLVCAAKEAGVTTVALKGAHEADLVDWIADDIAHLCRLAEQKVAAFEHDRKGGPNNLDRYTTFTFERGEMWQGWSPKVARFNWIVRTCIEQGPEAKPMIAPSERAAFVRCATIGWGREIVDALLISRDASLLEDYGELQEKCTNLGFADVEAALTWIRWKCG